MKRHRSSALVLLLAVAAGLGVGACDKSTGGSSSSKKKTHATLSSSDKPAAALSEKELFAKAYGVFPRLVAIAKKNKGDCDKIADGWKREFAELDKYVSKVKAIEASDPVKKEKYEKQYRARVIEFVSVMIDVKKGCKGNAKLATVLKSMR